MPVHRYRRSPNLYRDSVSLMRLAAGLRALPGVEEAAAVMATRANLGALPDAGLRRPDGMDLSPDDVLLVVSGTQELLLNQALDWAENELSSNTTPRQKDGGAPSGAVHTIVQAAQLDPAPRVAVISVPGEYAYGEALKALKAGMHVFLFSSGVSLEDELRLKQYADSRGLLMMGAECGTALIDGVPYGFANEARRGGIGLVGASGSGLQEVICLIHAWGGGISHAIGTGGRDLHDQIGGITMNAGLQLLAEDPATEVVLLVSKPPAPAVAHSILERAARIAKPVIVCFLGQDPADPPTGALSFAATLEEAARMAVGALGIRAPEAALPVPAPRTRPDGRVRGLFAGGTLCSEARTILARGLGQILDPGLTGALPLAHFCVDLGEERYTRGRPHPMIDPGLRVPYFERALADSATGVLLFDVVLGHGASPDPTGPLLEVLESVPPEARPVIVAHVCGTETDPQDARKQITTLEGAGVIVMPTNAAAARLTVEILQHE